MSRPVRELRGVVLGAFAAAVDRVEAEQATWTVAADRWRDGDAPESLVVLALGKAAAGMARGLVKALPGIPRRGVVVTGQNEVVPDGLELMIGSHPVPTTASLAAGERLLEIAASVTARETVIALVSGGGSAMVEALRPGVSLEELRVTTEELLRAGVAIGDINAVRRRLSRLKGGGLASAVRGAPPTTLALSDVIGDTPWDIASGPTVWSPDEVGLGGRLPTGVVDRFPDSVRDALRDDVASGRGEPADFVIVGNGPMAADAAAAHLRAHDIEAEVVVEPVQGEARETARGVLERLDGRASGALVFHGETTVTVSGTGRGGRNQEAALAAALRLDGDSRRVFLAAGTDGIDGPTPAAGGVVDGSTLRRGRALGLDAAACLEANDSHGYLEAVDALVTTGPTGTNVGDIWIAVTR